LLFKNTRGVSRNTDFTEPFENIRRKKSIGFSKSNQTKKETQYAITREGLTQAVRISGRSGDQPWASSASTAYRGRECTRDYNFKLESTRICIISRDRESPN
jgi:hypothetical protein